MRKLAKQPKKKQHFQDNAPYVAYMRQMRTFLRRGLIIASIAGVAIFSAGIYWLWHSGIIRHYSIATEEYYFKQTSRIGLTLQDVYLEGQHYTNTKHILSALDVDIGQPILSIPINHIRDRLEKLDWVQYAVVDRQLPHTLHVRIVAHTPIAIWQNAGKFHLVDSEGKVIDAEHIERFSNLMVLVGDDAPLYAATLLRVIRSDTVLAKNVVSAIRMGERRWNIRFNTGTEVKLPENGQEDAWRFLKELQEKKKVLDGKYAIVDLRVQGKVYMKPASTKDAKEHKPVTLKKS